MSQTVLVTGGAGFIGSHVVDVLLSGATDYRVVVLDKLTYAGNLSNLSHHQADERFAFVRADIADAAAVQSVFEWHQPDHVLHLAAESHVDRSISGPMAFVVTNVVGTATLLEVATKFWGTTQSKLNRFIHVSTDEVFGSLGPTGCFTETTPYDPRSPYSASKAGSDHLARAYYHTFGLPVIVTNCSNNYGPRQHPEKLIPLIISNLLEEKPLPVYGTGENVRDWLWVRDHAEALVLVLQQGSVGETYAIGGNNEQPNILVVRTLCRLADEILERPAGTGESLIRFVEDRPGHDLRYAIDTTKIKSTLNWHSEKSFESGLRETFEWYLGNRAWVEGVLSGAYLTYYEKQYGNRFAG